MDRQGCLLHIGYERLITASNEDTIEQYRDGGAARTVALSRALV